MTDTEVSVDTQAHRIAMRGRESLLERLRTAYGDAAAAHADLVSLDDARIEALVESAADRADGVQWRRALADAAVDELGVSASEARSHPAVVRAHTLVGAPSYEQSLAELRTQPVPPPASPSPVSPPAAAPAEAVADERHGAVEIAKTWPPQAAKTEAGGGDDRAQTEAGGGTDDELETVEADDVVLELLPEPDPVEYATQAYDVESNFTAAPDTEAAEQVEPVEPAAQPEEAEQPEQAEQPDLGQDVVVPAIHLGGVANLPTKREGLSLRLSADGLDIMHGEQEIVGRLIWDEIEMLEVPNLRMRRRHKQLRARLIVRTPHGDASFEVPEVSGDELRDRVQPLMELYGSS